MSNQPKGDDSTPTGAFSFLKDLATLSGIAFAYAFVSGYFYLSVYYESFNINIWTLDLPAYAFAPFVIVHLGKIWLVSIVVITASLLWKRTELSVNRLPRWASPAPSFFWRSRRLSIVSILLSANEGRKNAKNTVQQPYIVHLIFKDPQTQKYEPAMLQANEEGRLGLVDQTKDLVIVFDSPRKQLEQLNVYVFTRSDLSSVKISFPAKAH